MWEITLVFLWSISLTYGTYTYGGCAIVEDPDYPGAKVLGPNCHKEYLQALADQFQQNYLLPAGTPWGIYRSGVVDVGTKGFPAAKGNPESKDPGQWATFGVNRRISGDASFQIPAENQFTWAKRDLRPGVYYHDDTPVNLENPTNFYVASAFLVNSDTVKTQTEPGDVGNYNTKFVSDTNVHTERQLRTLMWNDNFYFLDVEVNSVYVYTYNTPCFRGCTTDVFRPGYANGIMNAAYNAVQKRGPETMPTIQFYLGFHTQYDANDDFMTWRGYQRIMSFSDTDHTGWHLIPLEGTVQSKMVSLFMADPDGFCKYCTIANVPATQNYLPNLSQRERAIYYILDTSLYMMEKFYANKLGISFVDLTTDSQIFSRDIRKLKDYISFRRIKDWMYCLRAINPDMITASIHEKIFNDVLFWQTPFFPPDQVFFTRIQRKIFKPHSSYGRIMPLGPPSAPKDFFHDLIDNSRSPWYITCVDPATNAVYPNSGMICEYPPNEAVIVRQPILRYMATFVPASPWVVLPKASYMLPIPGIYIVYGTSTDQPPVTTVHFINGGANMKALLDLDMVRLRLGNLENINPYQQAAKTIAYYPLLDPATETEIIGYVNLLKTTFCTFAENPENGGGEFSAWCHPAPAGLVDIATFFAQHFVGRLRDKARNPGPGTIPSIPTRLLNVPVTAAQYGTYSQESCLVANPTAGIPALWAAPTKRNATKTQEECEVCVHG